MRVFLFYNKNCTVNFTSSEVKYAKTPLSTVTKHKKGLTFASPHAYGQVISLTNCALTNIRSFSITPIVYICYNFICALGLINQ